MYKKEYFSFCLRPSEGFKWVWRISRSELTFGGEWVSSESQEIRRQAFTIRGVYRLRIAWQTLSFSFGKNAPGREHSFGTRTTSGNIPPRRERGGATVGGIATRRQDGVVGRVVVLSTDIPLGTLLDSVPPGIVRWSCVICSRSNLSLAHQRQTPPFAAVNSHPPSQPPSMFASFHSSPHRLSVSLSLSISFSLSLSFSSLLLIVCGSTPQHHRGFTPWRVTAFRSFVSLPRSRRLERIMNSIIKGFRDKM